jgi:hypothetical protein
LAVAAESCPAIRPPFTNDSDSLTKHQGNKKPLGITVIDASQGLMMASKMPPLGLEESRKTRGKTSSHGNVPPYVPPSGTINQQLQELICLWTSLDEGNKSELLTYARAIKNKN